MPSRKNPPALPAVPPECGPEIGRSAPARGPLVAFMPRSVVQRADGTWVTVDDGFDGRHAARAEDAFDRMERAARAAGAGRLFDSGQVAIARHYRTIAERHAGFGMRCSGLDLRTGVGGPWLEALLDLRARLGVLERRIGGGLAVELRRIRPSRRGSRRSVPLRALVDGVCLGDMTLGEVLRCYGWAVDGAVTARARRALCAALDRMQG